MAAPLCTCMLENTRCARRETGHPAIDGRALDFGRPFLPEALTRLSRLGFLAPGERRLMSQVQGRTYAGMFAFIGHFAGVKRAELAASRRLDDPQAFEALVRFAEDGIEHQALFRAIGAMAGEGMPPGYAFAVDPVQGARAVLAGSTWAVLALTCHFGLFAHSHGLCCRDPGEDLSPVFRDALLCHGLEAARHAAADERAWRRENERLTPDARDDAVDEFIALLRLMDGLLFRQARADAAYFLRHGGRALAADDAARLVRETHAAYRRQYLVRDAGDARFRDSLDGVVTPAQAARVEAAIAPLRR